MQAQMLEGNHELLERVINLSDEELHSLQLFLLAKSISKDSLL